MPDKKSIRSIVLLSGPIGAGKTTVARELVAATPSPISYIEGDTFWSFIAKSGPNNGRHSNFKMIMTSMITAAVPYALYGYEVIIDFSTPPWFLDTACRIAAGRDIPLDYVVLRPSEAICATRAATRAEGIIADYTPYSELYSSFDEAKKYIIQDDTCEPAAMAARIRKELNAGNFRISDKV
jgi:hypothetical protein